MNNILINLIILFISLGILCVLVEVFYHLKYIIKMTYHKLKLKYHEIRMNMFLKRIVNIDYIYAQWINNKITIGEFRDKMIKNGCHKEDVKDIDNIFYKNPDERNKYYYQLPENK